MTAKPWDLKICHQIQEYVYLYFDLMDESVPDDISTTLDDFIALCLSQEIDDDHQT